MALLFNVLAVSSIVFHRAKLGYGLLSGDYSKPAPDTSDENGASEPRVRNRTHTMFTSHEINTNAVK